MSAASVASASLVAALSGVEGVRYCDPGAAIDPPATVLGPPSLEWEAMCVGPTSARWLVYLVVPADDRAMERLWELVPTVAEALDAVRDAVVLRADPGTFLTGGVELPCYEIQVDYAL